MHGGGCCVARHRQHRQHGGRPVSVYGCEEVEVEGSEWRGRRGEEGEEEEEQLAARGVCGQGPSSRRK